MQNIKKTKIIASFILISVFVFSTQMAEASNLLDEFSSIYHSNVIIEVGVTLDESGHPKDSCYLKTIKGDKDEVRKVLDTFGIKEKKNAVEIEQKRLMAFYRNNHGKLRSMDLIRQGVGPYSDEDLYPPYVKMVKTVCNKLKKENPEDGGAIVLDSRSTCKTLIKNKYFSERYGHTVDESGFIVGGEPGVFREFAPLVRIECQGCDS